MSLVSGPIPILVSVHPYYLIMSFSFGHVLHLKGKFCSRQMSVNESRIVG